MYLFKSWLYVWHLFDLYFVGIFTTAMARMLYYTPIIQVGDFTFMLLVVSSWFEVFCNYRVDYMPDFFNFFFSTYFLVPSLVFDALLYLITKISYVGFWVCIGPVYCVAALLSKAFELVVHITESVALVSCVSWFILLFCSTLGSIIDITGFLHLGGDFSASFYTKILLLSSKISMWGAGFFQGYLVLLAVTAIKRN